MANYRFLFLAVGFTLFFIFITSLLNHFCKNNKFIKYSPGILSLAVSLYNFYLSRQASQGFEDIARIIIGILFMFGFMAALLYGLFIDIFISKIRKNK